MNAIRLLSLTLAGVALLYSGNSIQAGVAMAGIDPTASIEDTSINGTQWVSVGEGPNHLNVTYHFESGGVLSYSYNGVTYRNGSWKQEGTAVYFEMNQKYRETRATLHDDRIEGESSNIQGKKWSTVLTRSAPPK